MAVQESRLLQVTIFATLHKNTNNFEFSKLLPDVETIADHACLRVAAAESGVWLRRHASSTEGAALPVPLMEI
jgi:hypothetical protein